MPLFRWIGDLGGSRALGTHEVRHTIVRVTQQDIAAAEKYLRRHPSEDAIFVAEPERPDVYALGSITGTGAPGDLGSGGSQLKKYVPEVAFVQAVIPTLSDDPRTAGMGLAALPTMSVLGRYC